MKQLNIKVSDTLKAQLSRYTRKNNVLQQAVVANAIKEYLKRNGK